MDWKFWLQAFLAGVAALYTVLTYHRGGRTVSQGRPAMKRPFVSIGILLLLTWAAIGFDYYDRHNGETGSSVQMLGVIQMWGVLPGNRAFVDIDTRSFTSVAKDHYLALGILVVDGQVDRLLDRTVEKSSPFFINGDRMSIEMIPSVTFLARLGSAGMVEYFLLLVPKNITLDQILSLSDVGVLGGRLLATGGARWSAKQNSQ